MAIDVLSKRPLDEMLSEPGRIGALQQTGLLDTLPEETYDRITRLVCHALNVPVALLSLVDVDQHFFKTAVGLPGVWAQRWQIPLLYSFCRCVVASGAPLIVEDAGQHPLVCANSAVGDRDVKAYLGMPLISEDGQILGALCAVDSRPRIWATGEVDALRDLAAVAASKISLHRLACEFQARASEATKACETSQARVVQARRAEAFSHLASGVAHDFANVLQAVRSGVRVAIGHLDRNPAAVKHALDMVDDVTRRGAVVTRRLLSFARRRESTPTQVNLDFLFQKLGDFLRLTLASDIRIETVTNLDLSVLVSDQYELEMVLVNLATNACDAMPDGGTLTFEATRAKVGVIESYSLGVNPGCYIRLSVTDTGTGMDAATIAQASDPYFTTKADDRGTGLGLSLAREFVNEAAGGFALTSELGRGTNASLFLPAAQ
jgi:signal transduction histidine kinase